jgi:hypothetical protein
MNISLASPGKLKAQHCFVEALKPTNDNNPLLRLLVEFLATTVMGRALSRPVSLSML